MLLFCIPHRIPILWSVFYLFFSWWGIFFWLYQKLSYICIIEKEKNMAQQSKDRQIATQSSLKLVNEWSNTCGKCLTLKELVGITNVIVDYIEQGYSKEIGNRLDLIEEHLNNKGIESVKFTPPNK